MVQCFPEQERVLLDVPIVRREREARTCEHPHSSQNQASMRHPHIGRIFLH
jgi:hypothetical protein